MSNIDKIRKKLKTKETYIQLATLLKLFGDTTRIKILDALCCGELCVDDIASLLNITKSAVSHQLKPLRDAKLVKANRVGQNIFYSIADEHVEAIIGMGIEHLKSFNILD